MQHGMQLTDSSQLWMSNDLNLFAFLLEQCLSDILYINLNLMTQFLCVPWLTWQTEFVHLNKEKGREALGNGMLHPANWQKAITSYHLAWEKKKQRVQTGRYRKWEVACMLSYNLRLLPQVNTGSHAIAPLSPQESQTYAKYIFIRSFPAFLCR